MAPVVRRVALCGLAALLLLGVVHVMPVPDAPERPGVRIVLVTLDTLRRDALVVGAGERAPMERMQARARANGRVFRRFYAATSTTQPSHASLFTGLHPWEHGVTRNGRVLADAHVTLAERLRDAGFWTAAVVASSPLVRGTGMEQGFARFDDAIGRTSERSADYRLAETVTARALAALDAARGERQFLWLHYFDPHTPYGDTGVDAAASAAAYDAWLARVRGMARAGAPRAEIDRVVDEARARYRQDLAHLDAFLETLLARLDRDAQRFETHVLLVSDHGESFGEDDSLGHGTRVTPPQVQVPLVVFSPAFPPGESDTVAGSVDVFTSLLALAGLVAPDARGRDLSPRSGGDGPAGRGGAVGMRRTYDSPYDELRLDGSLHRHDGLVLFSVDAAGRLLRVGPEGDVAILDGEGAPEGAPRDALLARRREAIRALGSGSGSVAEVDEEAHRALEALGYVR